MFFGCRLRDGDLFLFSVKRLLWVFFVRLCRQGFIPVRHGEFCALCRAGSKVSLLGSRKVIPCCVNGLNCRSRFVSFVGPSPRSVFRGRIPRLVLSALRSGKGLPGCPPLLVTCGSIFEFLCRGEGRVSVFGPCCVGRSVLCKVFCGLIHPGKLLCIGLSVSPVRYRHRLGRSFGFVQGFMCKYCLECVISGVAIRSAAKRGFLRGRCGVGGSGLLCVPGKVSSECLSRMPMRPFSGGRGVVLAINHVKAFRGGARVLLTTYGQVY